MESSEHNWANISETIRPTMLVFGKKKASWMFFFQTILMNPIISQIQFFMTSHFSTLLPENPEPRFGENYNIANSQNVIKFVRHFSHRRK